jgi:hypothetical protein
MTFRVIGGNAEPPRDAGVLSQRFYDRYGTVEKLFAVIRHALAAQGHRVVVKYDRQLVPDLGGHRSTSRRHRRRGLLSRQGVSETGGTDPGLLPDPRALNHEAHEEHEGS